MILVVMAAGMGSRFGGIKQLTPIGPSKEFLIDYSIYDAIKVGIEKVVFVIKEEYLDLFINTIGSRIESKIKVEYVFQKMENIPEGYKVPKNRVKPWGTGQALLSAKPYIDNNFIIINADDFYGRDAFFKLSNYLQQAKKNEYGMVAYDLKNTLSTNGTVSRGICIIEDGYLKTVTERRKIGYHNNKLTYYENDEYYDISEDSKVSVNLFGFTPHIFDKAEEYFIEFLQSCEDLETGEFYLPTIVQKSIDNKDATMKVLETTSKFDGMTYKEDLEGVKENILKLVSDGVYPSNLWGE